MKEPVDHILRPRLPWRADGGAITECGLNAASVKTLSRGEYFARLKDLGQQRTALLTCMTCSHTATQWPTWEEDARLALQREITWEAVHYSSGRVVQWSQERGRRTLDELLAIETLIAAHPEEFQQLVANIDSRRQLLEKKALMPKPKLPKPDRGGCPKWRTV